jgi:hypothetical protein
VEPNAQERPGGQPAGDRPNNPRPGRGDPRRATRAQPVRGAKPAAAGGREDRQVRDTRPAAGGAGANRHPRGGSRRDDPGRPRARPSDPGRAPRRPRDPDRVSEGPRDPDRGQRPSDGRGRGARRPAANGARAAGRPAPAGDRAARGSRGGGGERPTDGGPPVSELLAAETLDELRETARPHAFSEAAADLAEALVLLGDDGEPEVAVRAARAAKRAAPRSAAVRELLGVALYQTGDYRAARTELAAAQRISGRVDLAALLADIERALGRPERAVALFEGADRTRMEPDTAAELLLVAASAYGDLGQPAAGAALIRRHARWPAALADHHLRLAYTEGTLAEQAGDAAGARAALTRVVRVDPDFHDAAERLARLDRP